MPRQHRVIQSGTAVTLQYCSGSEGKRTTLDASSTLPCCRRRLRAAPATSPTPTCCSYPESMSHSSSRGIMSGVTWLSSVQVLVTHSKVNATFHCSQVDQADADICPGRRLGQYWWSTATTPPCPSRWMTCCCTVRLRRGEQHEPSWSGDLPFGSYELSTTEAVKSAIRMLKEAGRMRSNLKVCEQDHV